ncbi:MAG: XVIPCD domain-containing protein, partial [Luteibacter jiangsuensis]
MANPHPALDAAINQFAQQPGVTPAQVASLRAALSSDPGLAQRLDADVSRGALHGFAAAAPGSPERPVGEYDPTTRTITLPAAAFPASGPRTELHSVLRVQAMVVEFAGKTYPDASGAAHPVTPDMLNNLQGTLNGSPALADDIKRAATTIDPMQPQHRILESFAFTAPGAGVGGSFSAPTHSMNLVSESLMTTTPPGGTGRYDPHDLTFVIGHEVQHGFNAQAAAQARASFVADVRTLAATPGPVHDYTALVERRIQAGREDEASAHISGWNALRSRVEHERGSVSLAAIDRAAHSRAADFLEVRNGALVPRANVQLNADLSMAHTPSNIAGMGHNYFDRPVHPAPGDNRQAMHLAHGGVEDYPNYYAGWAIAVIGSEERAAAHGRGPAPQIQINMKHAGLYEDMMEKAGLNLAPSKQSIPYLDGSSRPAVPHTFDHTADGPHQYQHVPVAPQRLDDPSHPDHALYQQARGHVIALDQSLG